MKQKVLNHRFSIKLIVAILSAFLLSGCSSAEKKAYSSGSINQDELVTKEQTESLTSDISESEINESETEEDTLEIIPNTVESKERILRLGFAGDINLAENHPTTQRLDSSENGLEGCIDPVLIKELNDLDIFMINNEFTYSDRGEPLPGKKYTFRANKERVSYIQELGTDIVLLANNHIFDYGEEAFIDTLDTLKSANIPYVGAGRDIEEACKPVFFDYDGVKIAYVAATRAEKNIMTPEASEDSPGVLRCYDPQMFLQVITEASESADYVIASVHFGTEYDFKANDMQRSLAKEMIDAGADAVIGSHAHVIQGIEYYNDKPIIYNLGNFWFNNKDLFSCVIEFEISINKDREQKVQLLSTKFLPCTQYNCYTKWEQEGDLRNTIIAYEEELSFDIDIDEDGTVRRR